MFVAVMTDSYADWWTPADPVLLVIGVVVSVAAWWLHKRSHRPPYNKPRPKDEGRKP
jgi:hypothetical protein